MAEIVKFIMPVLICSRLTHFLALGNVHCSPTELHPQFIKTNKALLRASPPSNPFYSEISLKTGGLCCHRREPVVSMYFWKVF